MKRYDDMCNVAGHVQKLLQTYGGRDDIHIEYMKADHDNINRFTDGEYFLIWEFPDINDDRRHLLYAVNVTGDSILTAASELMGLVARKF